MATYFNITLFKRNMVRFWPLAAVCFIAALLIFIVPEAASSNTPFALNDFQMNLIATAPKDIMTPLAAFCTIIVFPLSVFVAIAVFGYLHNPKAAGFISSLPVTRTGLYITGWISALALMLAPLLLVSVIYGFLLIGQLVPQGDFLRWLGMLIASNLIFLSIAVFCTFLTGNPVIQAFLYGIFNFIVYALYMVFLAIASLLVFGYSTPVDSPVGTIVNYLTPVAAIIRLIVRMVPTHWISAEISYYSSDYSGPYEPSAVLLWTLYLLFAGLMILFGYLLYRRRHIEAADDVLVHKPVKAVFKYLMGFSIGILMAIIVTLIIIPEVLWNSSSGRLMVWLTVSLAIFGALGVLFAEMIIKKRLNVFKSAYKGILVFAAVITAGMLFVRFDGTGFERRVPDPNNVASVSFSTDTWRYNSNSYLLHRAPRGYYDVFGENWILTWQYREQRKLEDLTLLSDTVLNEIKMRTPDYFESPEAIAAAVKLHHATVDSKLDLEKLREDPYIIWFTYHLTYTMKDGSIMVREYALPILHTPTHELVSLMLELHNMPEAVNKRNRFTSLPDNAVLGAILTQATEDNWVYSTHYLQRTYTGQAILQENGLDILVEALRKDAAGGTLGKITHQEILALHYYHTEPDITVGIIDLVLDFKAAGVPAAFEQESIHHESGIELNGLVLSIIINETHVNTVKALEEIGEPGTGIIIRPPR